MLCPKELSCICDEVILRVWTTFSVGQDSLVGLTHTMPSMGWICVLLEGGSIHGYDGAYFADWRDEYAKAAKAP